MNKDEYALYLKSDHWKRLRRRKIVQSNYRCEYCKSPYKLQVHHLSYDNLHAERLEELKCLCRRCHRIAHGLPVGPLDKHHWRRNEKSDKEKYLDVKRKIGHINHQHACKNGHKYNKRRVKWVSLPQNREQSEIDRLHDIATKKKIACLMQFLNSDRYSKKRMDKAAAKANCPF